MGNYIMNPNCTNEPCPVAIAVNIIGGKWKSMILYRLLGGKKRFNELKRTTLDSKPITHRTLTMQLRDLEHDGIVKRTVYPEIPPHVEYELTPLGLSMKPIIQALYDWGVDYKLQKFKQQ